MPPILNFETLRPALPCDYIGSYIVVPAFSYIGPIWKGASEVVTQFNYTVDRNFVLKTRPTKPANVNYCPVIRYRVGYTTYRYKLWSVVGEQLNVPQYNGEVIKKNFVIEIWNVATYNAVSSADGFNVELGIRKVPDYNYASLADYDAQDNTAEEVGPSGQISNVAALPTTGLLAQYISGNFDGVNLPDSVGSFDLAVTFGAPLADGSDVQAGYTPIQFAASDIISGASPFAGLAAGTTVLMIVVMKLNSWADSVSLFGVSGGGNSINLRQKAGGVSPQVQIIQGVSVSTGHSLYTIGDYVIAQLQITPSLAGNGYGVSGLGNNNNDQLTVSTFAHATNIILTGPMNFLECLCYDSSGAAELDEAVNHLLSKYGFGDAIPTEPSGDVAWLDNE